MLRVGLKLILPLALLAVSATSPVKAQVFAYGWAGYAFPQFGYAYGCPPVYYEPYCSSYADPCALPGFWAGYTLPYFYGGAYSPYRPATTDTAAVSTMAAACAIPFTEALLRHFADMEGAIWATEVLPELDTALASTAADPGSEPVVFEVAASGAAGVS
jgi:hypothetical protein